jgi:uncharacterized protein
MLQLVGRAIEVQRLKELKVSRKSEFVAIYGRRRVGKTFLIRQVFDNNFVFQHTGMTNVSIMQQLARFHASLLKHFPQYDFEPALEWFSALQQLIQLLERLPEKEKKVIFIDELPWLDTPKSRFLAALEHFWNGWASARDDILLIVCGSAASWMLNKLIHNRGGLHNRITDRIKLEPFTLAETEEFLRSKNVVYDRYQILILYMALGGIPFYLDGIRPNLSAMQNINALCFDKNAPFRTEYQELYASLFSKHKRHLAIISALARKNKGLNRSSIAKDSGITNGGNLTSILQELEESSFIRRYRSFGKKERGSLYQLIDMYSLFYLRFIKNSSMDDDNYWINSIDTPSFYTWGGYSFEMVCLNHVNQIKQALGISGVQTSVSTWSSPNVQIDLLIDRKDQVINLCEMKFSMHPFVISNKYAEKLRNKLGDFKHVTGTRKSLFLTMVTTYGIKDNPYSGMVQNDITMDALFKE